VIKSHGSADRFAFGFALDAIPEVLPNITHIQTTPSILSVQEKVILKKSFGYFNF
jgi:hypothetical protein